MLEQEDIMIKRSLQAIKVLQEKLEKSEKGNKEPIAVIGMGCRFPGGCSSPEKFWEFLKQGKDGIRDIPPERWDVNEFYDPNPDAVGKIHVRRAGFLDEDITAFDARFFGISPREAMLMDPQHRLLLEVGWEALERAGVTPQRFKGTGEHGNHGRYGSQVGVFIGITGSEFATLPRDVNQVDPYSITGASPNIAAGRMSYNFGFHGPTVAVDTACSSSLVAVHLACESLRRGECDMAMAGGVGVLLSPHVFVLLCKMNALAKDGKCKTFDAGADGYVRAEGCGVIVLKTLSAALEHGDPILAVIKGSAVNHDGSTSGLTVPNGLAQKELILKALKNAGLTPGDISLIEAHGTGTSLGDPIEVQAISDVFSGRNTAEPLVIGAVKSNIGHLEAAAGIASLIKVILSLQHKQIPPNLHLEKINPRISLEKIPAVIPTQPTPWDTNGKPRISGVSSFGFSGTNAHVILAEAPPLQPKEEKMPVVERPLHILALSARDENALKKMVQQYETYLGKNPGDRLADICYTANTCRVHLPHRLAFIAQDNRQLREQLSGTPAAAGKGDDGGKSMLAFVFNDGLNQMPAAARVIYDTLPTFKQSFDSCAQYFEPHYSTQFLVDFLRKDEHRDQPGIEDACLFCLQYAMAQVWESWGVQPTAVLGEGVGEYAAACCAGIMTPAAAAKYVVKYAGLLHKETPVAGELKTPKHRFISAVTGEPAKDEVTSPQYWQKRQAIQDILKNGLLNLSKQGYGQFIDMGAALPGRAAGYLPGEGVLLVTSLQAGNPWETLLKSVGRLYGAGNEIDWQGFDRDFSRSKLVLPTYPFQGKSYWPEPYTGAAGAVPARPADLTHVTVPVSDKPQDALEVKLIPSPLEEKQFQLYLNTRVFPELKDNRNVLHVGYYLEILSRIAGVLYGAVSITVKDMEYLMALYIEGDSSKYIQVTVGPRGEDGFSKFRFYSRTDAQETWTLHTQGFLQANKGTALPQVHPDMPIQFREQAVGQLKGPDFHRQVETQGFGNLGDSVKWVDQVWYKEGEILARLRDAGENEKDRTYALKLHPGILDTCAQLFLLAGAKLLGPGDLFMVVKMEEFIIDNRDKGNQLWFHLAVEKGLTPENNMRAQYTLFDNAGNTIAQAKGKQVKVVNKSRQEDVKKAFEKGTATGTGGQQTEYTEVFSILNTSLHNQHKMIMQDYLRQVVASILKMPVAEVNVNEKLMDLGVDSLVGVELKKIIDQGLSIDFPLQYIYETPTIAELAGKLVSAIPFKAPVSGSDEFFSQETKMDADSWVAFRKVNPAGTAKVRIFCFPYGVRGASLYRDWQEKLPDFIEVCPIQIPGKENRIREKPIRSLMKMIECAESALTPLFDRPVAFYGHSAGSFFAYRLAYMLWQKKSPHLKHLFVAGFSSPTIWPNPAIVFCNAAFKHAGFDKIPDMDEIREVSLEKRQKAWNYFGSLLETVTMPEESKRAVEPMTVEEYRLVSDYTPIPNEPVFDAPITAFHGDEDRVVSEIEMRTWNALTTGPFSFHILHGSHMFLHADEAQADVLKIITEKLEAYR